MYPTFEPSNHIRLLIHFMWGTQEPSPVLENEAMRYLLLDTLGQIAEKKSIVILCSAAHTDHLHVVVDMGKNQKSARIAHTLQDMSAEYFRKEFGLPLLWHNSFLAVSFAGKELNKLKQYLTDHHRQHINKSYRQELFEIIHHS